jgi:AcrR family transcriptional regulator
MKARSEKGALTRQNILRAASDLLHARGVAATSPDHVIDASGTGKGQFYYYFASKEGLVHAVLENYLEEFRSGRHPACFEIKTWNDLERWFAAHLDLQKRFAMTRSCPFGTIGNGVTEKDELVRQDLNLIFEIMRSNLTAFFVREGASATAKETKPEELADFCIAVVEGALLMGKIKRDARTAEAAVRTCLAQLKREFASTGQAGAVGPGAGEDSALLRREVRELRDALERIRENSDRVDASLHMTSSGDEPRPGT